MKSAAIGDALVLFSECLEHGLSPHPGILSLVPLEAGGSKRLPF